MAKMVPNVDSVDEWSDFFPVVTGALSNEITDRRYVSELYFLPAGRRLLLLLLFLPLVLLIP